MVLHWMFKAFKFSRAQFQLELVWTSKKLTPDWQDWLPQILIWPITASWEFLVQTWQQLYLGKLWRLNWLLIWKELEVMLVLTYTQCCAQKSHHLSSEIFFSASARLVWQKCWMQNVKIWHQLTHPFFNHTSTCECWREMCWCSFK